MKKTVFALAASLLAFAFAAPSGEARDDERTPGRPKVALALAGGGAAGIAHVGVIRELERLGVRPDCVAGTSMGAIVGGLYAAGYSPDQLERVVREIDWNSILNDHSDRSTIHPNRRKSRIDPFSVQARLPIGVSANGLEIAGGLVDGVKLTILLRELTSPAAAATSFDDLPIPFRAVATDLATGEAEILKDGDLATALRASMSIPALFPPMERDGKILVDGGVVNNLPIEIARDMCGGDAVVIGVNIPPAKVKKKDLKTLTGALSRSLSIFIHRRSIEQIKTMQPQDVLIEPDVAAIGMLDFDKTSLALQSGVEAVLRKENAVVAAMSAVSSMSGATSASTVASAAARAEQNATKRLDRIAYDAIQVDNESGISDSVILARLGLPDQGVVDAKTLRRRLARVYGLDLFDDVGYRIEEKSGRRILVIYASEKDSGPVEFRAGLNLRDDFHGDANYTLGLGVSFTNLNSLGGRIDVDAAAGANMGLRIRGEQPLNAAQSWFIITDASISRQSAALYVQPNDRRDDFLVTNANASVSLVWAPLDWLRIATEGGYIWGHADLKTGDPALLDQLQISNDWTGGWRVGGGFDIDTLDDPDFPRSGVQASMLFNLNPQGDDGSGVGQVRGDALIAESFGKHTISAFGFTEGELDTTASTVNAHFAGGFQRLSGYSQNELLNAVVGVVGLRYYYSFSEGNPFGGGFFAGGSFEYGGAWSAWEDIDFDSAEFHGSAFVGADTGLGPMVLGVGMGENGQAAGHFSLGYRF